jgi:glutathione S-transferase
MLPEGQRPTQTVAYETDRTNRALDGLEASGGIAAPFDAAHIVLGCALSVLSVRMPGWGWRQSRPRLAAWFDAVSARPSFRATMPPG